MICAGRAREAWKGRMDMAEAAREGSSTELSRLGALRETDFAAARGSTLRMARMEEEALRIAAMMLDLQKCGRSGCVCGCAKRKRNLECACVSRKSSD